jgi:hypothetical protein
MRPRYQPGCAHAPACRQGARAAPRLRPPRLCRPLLEQAERDQQFEAVQHVIREQTFAPRPRDPHLTQHPHRNATLRGQAPVHVVEQRPAGALDRLGDLERTVVMPLRQVLAQVARDRSAGSGLRSGFASTNPKP